MSDNRVLIDTSLWITFLRSGCPPSLLEQVRECLSEERAVGIGPVWLELLRGAGDESFYATLRDFLRGIPLLTLDEAMWETAYQLGFTLRRKGLTVPSMDIIIAAAAIRHHVALWHQDSHFDLISRQSPLIIHR